MEIIKKRAADGHSVQFYESDEYLISVVSDLVVDSIADSDAVIVIATEQHLNAFNERLRQRLGVQLGDAFVGQENCIFLNAEEVLRSFMVDGWPDERRFIDVIEKVLSQVQTGPGQRIRAFGEMVGLLCEQGKREAAIHLEMLWNGLARRHSFSLLCAYPMAVFSREENSQSFEATCALHAHVRPAEHENSVHGSDGYARMLATLQQKTRALEFEVERRKKIEQALKDREGILIERSAALLDANAQLKSEIEKRRNSENELLHTQRVLVIAQTAVHLGSWEMNVQSGALRCCDEFFRICGLAPQSVQLTLDSALGIVHPEDREATRQVTAEAKEKKQNYSVEKRMVRPDGSVRHVFTRGQVVLDAHGNLLAIVGSSLDITEQKLAEQALRRSEERFRSLVSLSSDWYWEQNEQLRFTELSGAGLRVLGVDPGSVLGLTAREIPVRSMLPAAIQAAHEADLAARRPFHDFECQVLNAKNECQHLLISGEPVFDSNGAFTGYRGVGKNVTERKKAEDALRRSHDDLRKLAAHQEKIKEEERKRIAREIHDELGGSLTGLKAFLTVSMERTLKAGMSPDKLLMDASDLTDVAIESVRRIITDLRPSVLDQLGVWAALEWYADQIVERSNLTCRCNITKDAAATYLDAERSTALFRIVQEALTNVLRHAKASAIRMEIERQGDCILVEIEDDGKGIAAERLLDAESWGIQGMYERVRHFGGELKISGMSGQGTTVLLRVPLKGFCDD